jgi:hypothetical protein
MSRTYCLLIAWLVATYAAEAAAMPLSWSDWQYYARHDAAVGVFIGYPVMEPFMLSDWAFGDPAFTINAVTFLIVAPTVYIVIRRYFGHGKPRPPAPPRDPPELGGCV